MKPKRSFAPKSCEALYDEMLPDRHYYTMTGQRVSKNLPLPCDASQLRDNFETAMRYLTEEDRRIVELRLAGHTYKDIAVMLGLGKSAGHARAHYCRALCELRAPVNLDIIEGRVQDDPSRTPLTELGLRSKERYALVVRLNVNSIEQLCELSPSQLQKARCIGEISISHISEKLAERGLRLR